MKRVASKIENEAARKAKRGQVGFAMVICSPGLGGGGDGGGPEDGRSKPGHDISMTSG